MIRNKFILFLVLIIFPISAFAQIVPSKDQLKANVVVPTTDSFSKDGDFNVTDLSLDEEERISAVCRAAETEGLDTFRKCSKDCKTVCTFGERVNGENCFKCQQGGDDTCNDIGLLDAPHQWCQPGGVCHADPMMYCTPPAPAVGPRRSKLMCTSCKKRPDMCWQKVQDGTTTLTNCKLGCWNGTCEYKGKYTEKEWDGSDEYIHCYECITPPPPPTCEDLGWGHDWENDCWNQCEDPNYCKEFEMVMGGPNDCCDKKAQAIADGIDEDDKDDEDDGDNGPGTRTRGGNPWGPGPKPPAGSPWAPGGPLDPNRPVTKEELCKEVKGTLENPGLDSAPTIWEQEQQLKRMQAFEKSLEAYKNKAQEVESHLAPHRSQVEALGKDVEAAKEVMNTAEKEMKASSGTIYGYDSDKEAAYNKAKKNWANLQYQYSEAVKGYKRRAGSLGKEVEDLRHQAQKDLWQADPRAKQSEELGRTDQYFDAWESYNRVKQRREIADEVFDQKRSELQEKVDRGGSKAKDYQQQLDNLNREKKEWDNRFDRQEDRLAKEINRQQSQNATDGVGPYSKEGLFKSLGKAAQLLNGQIAKIESLRRALKKAIKNNCPPENAKEILKALEGQTDGLDDMIKNLEARQRYADEGFPLTDQEKKQLAQNIAKQADSGAQFDGVKSMWDFYLKEQANEIARTFDPTDPSVRMKKAFWYTVGIAEGVGKAVKGLAELGAGALDLIAETGAKYASYAGIGDGTLFGTDASDALQSFLGAADGNLNLDGLEKLANVVKKSTEDYFTKLSKAKDLDKATARAGGQIAGEVVVGDAVIAGALGKAGTLVKGVLKADEVVDVGRAADKLVDTGTALDKAADGTRVRQGLKAGDGAIHAPPKGPDIDDLTPSKTPDTLPGSTPRTEPKKPRAPSQKGKDFKGKKLPDQDVDIKPLNDSAAEQLATESGFRPDHAKNMHQLAQEKGVFVVVRDGNPDSIKFMNDPNKMPKPMSSKAKTAKAGPEDNRGLVVDPTHPQQSAYWDADIAKAKADGDLTHAKWLEEQRDKAVKTWKNYGDEMKRDGYSVNEQTGVIEYTDPKTGRHYDGVHGDYDLHDVVKPGKAGSAPKKVNFGSGNKFDVDGVDVEGGEFREAFSKAIDSDKDYILHGGQGNWKPDPKKVPIVDADPPVTVFRPDGGPPIKLETAADMKKFYQEEMGMRWEFPEPKKPATGAVPVTGTPQPTPKGVNVGGSTPRAPPEGAGIADDVAPAQNLPDGSTLLDDSVPTHIDSKSSKIPDDGMPTHLVGGEQPKVSTNVQADSDLNFVSDGGQQVELKTGKQLGAGSTSTVYVDAANPDQVIRVTNMASDEVREAVKLDAFGRQTVEDISQRTDSIRVSEVYERHTVQNMPGSHVNNKVVEIGENMKQGMAKDMIKKQGGQMTEAQAQAYNRAVKDLNEQGYAWLDAKPDNYTFEQIPGTDDLRVVIVDPGGVVPMKGLDPKKAKAIQSRINKPSQEFVEGINSVGNPEVKNLVAGEEWGNIIKAHGDDIDIKALGVNSPNDVKFNPSGNVNQPRVSELFEE